MKYVVSDIHGQYDLWKQVRDYIKPEDTLYFLGDACDRGPNGAKIIYELLTTPNVIYMKGNHEDLLINTLRSWKEECYDPVHGNRQENLHLMNGGLMTLQSFLDMPDSYRDWYVRQLESLPEFIEVKSGGRQVLLSHAGFTPAKNLPSPRSFRPKDPMNPLLWDRRHLMNPWPQDEKYKHTYIIHGHTPVMAINPALDDVGCIEYPKIPDQIFIYADGHKIDLDLGSFRTHKIALFNLNTFEVERYFVDKENLNENNQ